MVPSEFWWSLAHHFPVLPIGTRWNSMGFRNIHCIIPCGQPVSTTRYALQWSCARRVVSQVFAMLHSTFLPRRSRSDSTPTDVDVSIQGSCGRKDKAKGTWSARRVLESMLLLVIIHTKVLSTDPHQMPLLFSDVIVNFVELRCDLHYRAMEIGGNDRILRTISWAFNGIPMLPLFDNSNGWHAQW